MGKLVYGMSTSLDGYVNRADGSITIHGLRHTSATLAAQLGATLAELQARIGHSTPTLAMRYQHVAAERDAQLAARMSAFATGGSRWTAAEPRSAG